MSKPKDFNEGLDKFGEFHQLSPKKVGSFGNSFKIPTTAYCVGEATCTYYRSKKWDNVMHEYYHDHEGGVKVYSSLPVEKYNCIKTFVPKYCQVSTLIKLGDNIGLDFIDLDNEERQLKITKPFPELYCNPTGNCLYIVDEKTVLVALLWGGHLSVQKRGIVG